MKAQLCPKCNGSGTMLLQIGGTEGTWVTHTVVTVCDLCNGGKVIYVPDEGCYPAYCPEKYMGEI
jgi:DnaJ-class molecular chaperone